MILGTQIGNQTFSLLKVQRNTLKVVITDATFSAPGLGTGHEVTVQTDNATALSSEADAMQVVRASRVDRRVDRIASQVAGRSPPST